MAQDTDLHPNGYIRDDFIISDAEGDDLEETDDDEDAFEPIRVAGKPVRSRKWQLGPPITTDEKLDHLNETHRMIVEDFVHHAKEEGNNVSLNALDVSVRNTNSVDPDHKGFKASAVH